MADWYQEKAKLALSLLTRYGQQVTIRRETQGAYDPATGQAGVTVAEGQAMGAVFDYSQRDIDGALVQASDRRVYLDASADVKVGDKLVVGGKRLVAVRVSPLNPAGTIVLHEVQARGDV